LDRKVDHNRWAIPYNASIETRERWQMTNSGGGVRRFFGTLMRFLNTLRAVVVNVLFLFLLVLLLIVLFGEAGEAPVPDGVALVLSPTGVLVEDVSAPDLLQRVLDPTSSPAETRVKDLLDAVNHAANDDRIAMLVLDLDEMRGGDLAKLTVIGEALVAVRESGKPVVAVG